MRFYLLLLAIIGAFAARGPPQQDTWDPDSKVLVLTDENATLLSSGEWLFEIYAPWCGHCKRLAPELNKVAEAKEGTHIRIAKLNGDFYRETPTLFQIRGYPSLFHIKDGVVRQLPGNYRSIESSWAELEVMPWYVSPFSPVAPVFRFAVKVGMWLELAYAAFALKMKPYDLPFPAWVLLITVPVFLIGILLMIRSMLACRDKPKKSKEVKKLEAKKTQ